MLVKWKESSISLHLTGSAPLLKMRFDFDSFIRWPDTLQYLMIKSFNYLAFSTVPYKKNSESTTKNRRWSPGQPLLITITFRHFFITSFSICLDNTPASKINRQRDNGPPCLIRLLDRMFVVQFPFTRNRYVRVVMNVFIHLTHCTPNYLFSNILIRESHSTRL